MPKADKFNHREMPPHCTSFERNRRDVVEPLIQDFFPYLSYKSEIYLLLCMMILSGGRHTLACMRLRPRNASKTSIQILAAYNIIYSLGNVNLVQPVQ